MGLHEEDSDSYLDQLVKVKFINKHTLNPVMYVAHIYVLPISLRDVLRKMDLLRII